ncbi:MAG: F0F1 ATP synthase subunit A, partial [Chitinophagaceae bacterium]
MRATWVKSLLVAIFSVFVLHFVQAQEQQGGDTKHEGMVHKEGIVEKEAENKFDANEAIFGHVMDAHEFHFLSWKGSDGQEHHATIPLPVLLYSPQKGFSAFMSSKFHHGLDAYDGYRLQGNEIFPVDQNVTVYDLSLTRNV